MINIDELIKIMQINGLGSNASSSDVENLLNLLRYSEENKKETIAQLESRGWFGGQAIVSPVQPATNINSSENFQTISPLVPSSAVTPSGSSYLKVLLVAIVLIILLAGGGGLVFAYIKKIGPFTVSSYSEKDFLSNLLAKVGQINTLSYTMSGSLDVSSRDKDAKTFTPKVLANGELKKKYDNDLLRLEDASTIIDQLNMASGYSSYSKEPVTKNYPADIKNMKLLTKDNYAYQLIDGGKDFALTINFETDNAIKVVRNSNFSRPTSTIIVDKKVTFSKNSSTFMYMSNELPKPFLVQMSESMRMLPPDINAQGAFSLSSDLRSSNQAGWKANIEASGDFGDLSYKVNIDTLKKGQDYYLKINNMPALSFLGDLSLLKGKWVNLSARSTATTTTLEDYSIFSSLEKSLTESETKYKENREKSLELSRKIFFLANKEGLIYFKEKPRSEKISGRQLVRYELGIRKEKILPFYRQVEELLSKEPEFAKLNEAGSEAVKYLESEEFNEAFAYFDENVRFTFWADGEGYPAASEVALRVVPPDTATQLKDKQINITFKTLISDINKSLNIEAPTEAIPLQKVIEDFQKNQN